MSKLRSQALDYVAYVVFRCMTCVLQAIPVSLAEALVRGLAWVAYRLDRRHRNVALENLRIAFPGRYTEVELRAFVLDVYRHFGMMLLEMALVPRRLRSRNWRNLLASQFPELAGVRSRGRPILVVTAHFGCWELAHFFLSAQNLKCHLVARPLDNPYVDKSIRLLRESWGHKVLAKHGDLKKMCAVLQQGGAIVTLADQDAGARGMFVEFFGRPASTHRAIAFLARRTGALIAVMGGQKVGGLFENIPLLMEVIDPHDFANHADADRAITQRLTHAVERMVLRDPRQYLWLHRRWKHAPPAQADTSLAA